MIEISGSWPKNLWNETWKLTSDIQIRRKIHSQKTEDRQSLFLAHHLCESYKHVVFSKVSYFKPLWLPDPFNATHWSESIADPKSHIHCLLCNILLLLLILCYSWPMRWSGVLGGCLDFARWNNSLWGRSVIGNEWPLEWRCFHESIPCPESEWRGSSAGRSLELNACSGSPSTTSTSLIISADSLQLTKFAKSSSPS